MMLRINKVERLCFSLLNLSRKRKTCVLLHKMSTRPYVVTTPIFYVNSRPHIGHLYTALLADAHCRFRALSQPTDRVIFSTGTDEHGLKIQQAAARLSLEPGLLCNEVSSSFQAMFDKCGVDYTTFVRTTDPRHVETVCRVWEVLEREGWLYKAEYQGWYSVQDETFLPDSQVEQRGEEHFSLESGHRVEWNRETNWMFKLTRHKERLLEWLEKEKPIHPPVFKGQVEAWLSDPNLGDLSVSRPRARLRWGIPVPGDPQQTIYVWLDALVNYLTVAGYPQVSTWPPTLQILGKDILKFHAIYWPAFLASLSLSLPPRLQVHSHWTVDGVKMSKSLGNIVDPVDLLSKYTEDGTRYFLLREGVPEHDGNFSESRMVHCMNLELADTLGNLLNRATSKGVNPRQIFPWLSQESMVPLHTSLTSSLWDRLSGLQSQVTPLYENLHFNAGLVAIMDVLRLTNLMVQEEQPWTLKTSDPDRLSFVLYLSLESLRVCGVLLQPVVPSLSDRLLSKLSIPSSERGWDLALPGVGTRQNRDLAPGRVVLFNKIR